MEQEIIVYIVIALAILVGYAYALWKLGTDGKPLAFGLVYMLPYGVATGLSLTLLGLSLLAGNVLGIIVAGLLILPIALKGYASYLAAGETQKSSFILVLFVPFAWIFYLLGLGRK